MTITWQDFEKVDIRIGTIVEGKDFPKARNPAFILHVDFGVEIGLKIQLSNYRSLYQGSIARQTSYGSYKF